MTTKHEFIGNTANVMRNKLKDKRVFIITSDGLLCRVCNHIDGIETANINCPSCGISFYGAYSIEEIENMKKLFTVSKIEEAFKL